MIELRPYQTAAIAATWQFFRDNPTNGVPLIVAPTGSGKSLIIAKLIEMVIKQRPNYRTLVVSHRKEILEQNALELQGILASEPIGIWSAGLGQKRMRRVTYANIQSIYKADIPETHLVIIDECFVGETLISVPGGFKRIDLVGSGDVVYTAGGLGTVKAISIKPAKTLFKIVFSDGTKIRCTGNHRIFTADKGWVAAAKLEQGQIAFSEEGLRLLWERVSPLAERGQGSKRKRVSAERVLLNLLLKEIEKPNVESEKSGKNERNFKANRAQAYQAWRERAIAALATARSFTCPRGGVGGGSRHPDKDRERKRISDLLQAGYWKSFRKNRDRVRRGVSWDLRTSRARSQKNCSTYFPWVVNISRDERESVTPVYNLQIEGHPSYFANGKLVHNCHLLPPDSKSMYQKFISRIFDKNRSCRVLGLTATPYRLDSGSLLDNDSLFTDIAYDISIRDLIDQGYLSNLISRISESAVDLSEVKRSGYDYNQTDAEAAFNPETEKHCDEIIAKAGDRKHWLLFCSGIKHAEHTAEVLTARGIPTHAVHGDLLNMERDRRINEFKAGKVRALTNCNILTTGFNHRAVDLLVLLRATKSTALFVQMVGRGMRTATGKANCLVLDFGNNIKTHGPIDLIKVKAKKGQKTEISRMPSKTCPMCGCVVFIKVTRCPSCDYAFPSATCVLQPVASTAPIISEPQTHTVVNWDAKIHKKEGKPDSLRLTYKLEGGGQVSDFLCFEHGGFAAQMARKKWVARAGNIIPPATAEEAFIRIRELAEPKTVSLVQDGKYHRILSMTLKAPEEEFDSVKELGINI